MNFEWNRCNFRSFKLPFMKNYNCEKKHIKIYIWLINGISVTCAFTRRNGMWQEISWLESLLYIYTTLFSDDINHILLPYLDHMQNGKHTGIHFTATADSISICLYRIHFICVLVFGFRMYVSVNEHWHWYYCG